MFAPVGAPSTNEAVQMAAEVYSCLKEVNTEKHGKSAIGIEDEGGLASPVHHPSEALDLLFAAIEVAGHTGRVRSGSDPASQSFFEDDKDDMGFNTSTAEPKLYEDMAKLYH